VKDTRARQSTRRAGERDHDTSRGNETYHTKSLLLAVKAMDTSPPADTCSRAPRASPSVTRDAEENNN